MFFSIHTEPERPRFPRPHDPFLLNRGSYFIITEKHPAGKRFRKKVRGGNDNCMIQTCFHANKENRVWQRGSPTRENLRIIPWLQVDYSEAFSLLKDDVAVTVYHLTQGAKALPAFRTKHPDPPACSGARSGRPACCAAHPHQRHWPLTR